MFILYLFLFTTALARSESILIDKAVDSSMNIISNHLNKRLSERISTIKFHSELARKEFSEYVSLTLTKPTLAQERSLIKSEVNKVVEAKQPEHLLISLKSLCNKIIEKIKLNTQKWAKDQKNILASGNMVNSLSKRESEHGKWYQYRFPHLFDEVSFTSAMLEQFLWPVSALPLQTLFLNQYNQMGLSGTLNYWLLSNFMVQPLFNRVMYGHYFYQADEIEYYS